MKKKKKNQNNNDSKMKKMADHDYPDALWRHMVSKIQEAVAGLYMYASLQDA